MRSPARLLSVCLLVFAACNVTDPDDIALHPTLLFSVAPQFADEIQHVDRVALVITRPGGGVRAVHLTPQKENGHLRARFSLFPDEGQAGTSIDVRLSTAYERVYGTRDVDLFHGTTVLTRQADHFVQAVVRLQPILHVDIPAALSLTVGDTLQLASLGPIRFSDGQPAPPYDAVVWGTNNTGVLPLLGDTAAYAAAPGAARIRAEWNGRWDYTEVTVLAASTTASAPTP